MNRLFSVLIGAIALTTAACTITSSSSSEPDASAVDSQVALRESSAEEVLDRLIESYEPETEISDRSQTLVSRDRARRL